MVKGKEEKKCNSCGTVLSNEEAIYHLGKDYCPECMAEHIKNEHVKRETLTTSEEKKAWTYKSY